MDGFLARRAQQRRIETGNWYQQPVSLIRKHHVFAETKAAKKEKKSDSSSSSSGSETDGGSKKDKKKKKKRKGRCWSGYEPTPGKEPYSDGSCRKK